MQNRTLPQYIFRPVDDEGQRIDIDTTSNRSQAMAFRKKHQIWATKPCWIKVGDGTVVAVGPSGTPVAVGGSFPLSPGAVYEYEPKGSNDAYVAVIEDTNYTADDGWLFIGRAER